MKVMRARYAGACYGVLRALEMAKEAATSKEPVYTLGPLIHNPQVVQTLEKQGVFEASTLDAIECGTVVIRSHGVVPRIKQQALDQGLTVVDATCPHVALAQKAAAQLAREGQYVVVVGEAGHPEVEGLRAYAQEAGGRVVVVANAEELPHSIEPPVGVVVQTTQSKEVLDDVAEALEQRSLTPDVKNTICFATRQRQEAADELSRTCDVFVVIGGRNSSNTTRLYDIGKANCSASYHIESPDELDVAWFKGCEIVGVCAGASTPEDQIEAVIERLESW